MALLISANTQFVNRTASLPSSTAFTACGFFTRTGTGDGTWETVFGLNTTGTTNYHLLYCRENGVPSFAYYSADPLITGPIGGITVTNNVWYFWALVGSGSGAGGITVYVGPAGGTLSSSSTTGSSFTPVDLSLGRNTAFTEWSQGQHAGFRLWDVALTAAEVNQESLTLRPSRTANLSMWTPFIGSSNTENLEDWSGNARGWTQGGTTTVGQGSSTSFGSPTKSVFQGTGVVSYTLACNSGSFSLSGGTTTSKVGYKLPSTGGTFALTGQVATLTRASTEQSVFTSQTPASVDITDAVQYEMGMKFSSSVAGVIKGVRFWRDAGENLGLGPIIGKLWSAGGTLLKSVTFDNLSGSGWQRKDFDIAYPIASGTTYVVSVNLSGNKFYVVTAAGLASVITNGNLSSIDDNANGVYNAVAGSFPSTSFNESNYFRDIIFTASNGKYTLVGESGSYALTGTAATLHLSPRVSPDVGFFVYTGQPTTLVYTSSTGNFFVDPQGGLDSNNGTSISTPWKTLPGTRTTNNGNFLNSAWGAITTSNKIPAGTVIVLKAGATHSSATGGKIQIDSSYYANGTSGSPTIIQVSASWGSGNFLFNGSGVTIPADNGFIGVFNLANIHLKGANDTRRLEVSNAPGQAGILVKGASSGSRSAGYLIDYADVHNCNYIGIDTYYTDGLIIRNTKSHHNGVGTTGLGVSLGGVNDALCTNVILEDGETYNNGAAGASGIRHGVGVYACTGVKIRRWRSYSNGRDGFDIGTVSNSGTCNGVLSNCYSYLNGEDGVGLNGGTGANVSWYIINSVFLNNSNGMQIYEGCSAHVYHCILHANNDANFGGSILTYSGAVVSPITSLEFKNNIFFKVATNAFHVGGYTGNVPTIDSNNNLWIPRTSNTEVMLQWPYGGTNYTYAGATPSWWGASEKRGTAQDPGFVSITSTTNVDANNYHLSSAASPASGAGTYLSSPVEVLLDRDGVTRLNPPEIGIYEFSIGTGPTLSALGGTFALTGTAATPRKGSKVSVDINPFVVAGQDATFSKHLGFTLGASSGSFSLSGGTSTSTHPRKLVATGTTFSDIGGNAGLTKNLSQQGVNVDRNVRNRRAGRPGS